MLKRNKPPVHRIDEFIEELYIDNGELRRIGYEKLYLETQMKEFFNGKYDLEWRDFTSRIYWHEQQIKRFIANGIILNPRNLRSTYQDDRLYWRDHAIPTLVSNNLYYVRFVDGEWKAMASLEDLSYKGSKKVKQHLLLAHEESLHMADTGAKIKSNLQAKFILKDIKDLNKVALEFDVKRLRKNE